MKGPTVDNMSTWEHSGFNVFAFDPIAPHDTGHRHFVARYLKKAPLSLQRLKIIESQSGPTVQNTKHPDDGDSSTSSPQVETRELPPLEFLAELSCHIPDM